MLSSTGREANKCFARKSAFGFVKVDSKKPRLCCSPQEYEVHVGFCVRFQFRILRRKLVTTEVYQLWI